MTNHKYQLNCNIQYPNFKQGSLDAFRQRVEKNVTETDIQCSKARKPAVQELQRVCAMGSQNGGQGAGVNVKNLLKLFSFTTRNTF